MNQRPLPGNSKPHDQKLNITKKTPTLSMTISTISWSIRFRVSNKRNENGGNKNFLGTAVLAMDI